MTNDGPALRKIKQLLLDWVNLPGTVTDDWLDSMLEKHRDVFSPFAHNRDMLRNVIEKIRVLLLLAWKAPDMRRREWSLFIARQEYSRALLGLMPASRRNMEWLIAAAGGEEIRPFLNVTKLLLVTPPPETAFDRAGIYAQRMSTCEGPSCEERFFLRGAKHERYCPACKHEARLRSKKRYYYAKGKYHRRRESEARRVC